MTEQELAEIRARADAATPGPWVLRSGKEPYELAGGDDSPVLSINWIQEHLFWRRHEDAVFAEHARTDIPALIAEIERLREALATGDLLNEHHRGLNGPCPHCQRFYEKHE